MKTLTKEITIDLTLQSTDELAALFNLIHNSNMDGQTFFICGEAADVLDNLVARVGKGMARHLIEQDDRYRMTAQDLDDIFQNTDEKEE